METKNQIIEGIKKYGEELLCEWRKENPESFLECETMAQANERLNFLFIKLVETRYIVDKQLGLIDNLYEALKVINSTQQDSLEILKSSKLN